MTGIEHIHDTQGNLLAIVVTHHYDREGVSFVTPQGVSQQLAYMRHPKGKVIDAHLHGPVTRTVTQTHETILVKRGRLRADFYNAGKRYMGSKVLRAGDAILLVSGGHAENSLCGPPANARYAMPDLHPHACSPCTELEWLAAW